MTEQDRRNILIDTVKTFGKQEWFRDAVLHESHPITGDPTLELKVNYIPFIERKKVKDFVLKYNLVERFTQVDKNGNPVE